MLDIRDVRALEGANLYELVPAVLLRYVGADAELEALLSALAQAAGALDLAYASPQRHGPSALGEMALTWRTPYPNALAALLEHILDLPDALSQAEIGAVLADERPAPALAALIEEARQRSIPVLRGAELRFGYGAASWPVDPAAAPPWEQLGRIPIIAVTGTNGKTTTARLIDFTLRSAQWRTGRTDTDGIWINGEIVESGDWTGFGGATAVLASPAVEIAVLETARGGILRRGVAFERCDVAVVTNVAEDHLPDRGIATLEELARTKATIVRLLASDGQAVLNADDPTVVRLIAPLAGAPITWFSMRSDSALVAEHCQQGGTALFLRGVELILAVGAGETVLLSVANLPIAHGGLAQHNLANALAAAGALRALGLSPGQITFGLATFQSSDNPGRLNRFERAGVIVLIDYAHNSDGLRVLINSATPLVGSTGRLFVIYSGTGDRTDAQLHEQGQIIGQGAQRLIIKRDAYFLRGRPEGQVEPLLRAGAEAGGLAAAAIIELEGDENSLNLALSEAQPGDVIAFALHKDRARHLERLRQWEQT